MEHVPTKESDVEKVYRIARELGIGLEEAVITCEAFELAFSDDRMRRAIFEIVDQLDESAWKKGEPLGLIIRYTVELGLDGIRVGRYADEIPPGEVVSLTPRDRAEIFLKIKDNFPTQEFLGPLIVNRPELPSMDKEGWQTDVFCRADGVVCSSDGITESGIQTDISSLEPERTVIFLGPSSLESATVVICLGPIRLKFNERFPFVSAAASETLRTRPTSCFRSANRTFLSRPLAIAASHSGQFMSGLSPPPAIGECGHSASKAVPRPFAIDVETHVSHLDL